MITTKQNHHSNRFIAMPGPLRILHGECATTADLALVYLGGGLITLAIMMGYRVELAQLDSLGRILFFLLALDLSGGVIANLSFSTNSYWRSKSRALRTLFLVSHSAQAMALCFLFPMAIAPLRAAFLWMLGSSGLLGLSGQRPQSPALGLILCILGTVFIHGMPGATPLISLLALLYFLKLIYAFGASTPQGVVGLSISFD